MLLASPQLHAATIRILLIEDSLTSIEMAQRCLEEAFSDRLDLMVAQTFNESLEILNNNRFDVIILDLGLPFGEDSEKPRTQGLDMFHAVIQANPKTPIVILTSSDDEEQAIAAVREGAQDYILKGQMVNNPLARAVSFALERSRRQQFERAMCVAEEVQQGLYPPVSPWIPGYDISGKVFPAEHTSGDYFDFIPMVDGSVGIVVGDVSGHGLGPALVMTQTRAYLRSLAEMWSYVRGVAKVEMHVGDLLTHANRLLVQNDDHYFVTLFYAQLHPDQRTMTYASAGHQGYLLRQDGTCETLESTGMILGMLPGIDIPPAASISLEPGDLLLLPTDGIEETSNNSGQPFGKEAMIQFVHEHRHLPATQIIDKLHRETNRFQNSDEKLDDWTAIIMKVEEDLFG